MSEIIFMMELEAFFRKAYTNEAIFFIESETSYEFYSYFGRFLVKTVKEKSEKTIENMIWLKTHFEGRRNIHQVKEVALMVQPVKEEEDSNKADVLESDMSGPNTPEISTIEPGDDDVEREL